jgi:hypothetical protein
LNEPNKNMDIETALTTRLKVLFLGEGPPAANVLAAVGSRWELVPARPDRPLCPQLSHAGLAIICPGPWANDPHRLCGILEELDRSSAIALLLMPADAHLGLSVLAKRRGQFICVSRDASVAELSAKLSAATALQPAISSLQGEILAARKVEGEGVSAFEELDEELRLAARLQRDFLPRRLPDGDGLQFAALFRPVGWVSGDIYDVQRLDETHVGFYIADAVGHGLSAALLTMFIKKAMLTKRIIGNSYQIVSPHTALTELNIDICEQNLSASQFCTAAYCVLDRATLKLQYARAGHPEPVILRADGTVVTLAARGSLLGVFPNEEYEPGAIQLLSGDRVILYTDGLEALLAAPGDRRGPDVPQILSQWAQLPRGEMLFHINELVDSTSNSAQQDDVTVLVMDVQRD